MIAPSWSNSTTIGYSVVHNPVELGSVINTSSFHSQHGLSLRLSLQVNPNALLIEEESKYSSLDFLSKTGALIIVLLMNGVERCCMHTLPKKTKSLTRMLMTQMPTGKKADMACDEPGDRDPKGGHEPVELEELPEDVRETALERELHSTELSELRVILRELISKQDTMTREFRRELEEKDALVRRLSTRQEELNDRLKDQEAVVSDLRHHMSSVRQM